MITAQHKIGISTVSRRVARKLSRRTPLSILVAMAAVLEASPVCAERWQIRPTASLKLGYDDNVRLAYVAPQSGFGAGLSAALRAARSNENSEVGFAFGLDGVRYPSLTGVDSTDGYVSVDLGRRLEHHQFRLSSRFVSQSTMTSEAATTGLVQVNRQQNLVLINPSWTYFLSERTAIDAAINYQDVSYIDVQAMPLFNYRFGTANLGASYRWSERLKLSARASYDHYSTQGYNNAYESVGGQAGAEYQVSETASIEALAGLRRTRQTFGNTTGINLHSDSEGPIFVLSFSQRFEAGGRVKLAVRRALEPSGSGQLLDTTGFAGGLTFPVWQRWLFSLDAVAYRNRNSNAQLGLSVLNERRYVSVAPSLSYELDESWQLSAGYSLRWQNRNDILRDAMSNAVYLTLKWTPPVGP